MTVRFGGVRRWLLGGGAAVALILGSLGMPATVAAPADEVNVPDAGLAACMRERLGITESEPITEGGLAGPTGMLTCTDVNDLTGIEYATRISTLKLEGANSHVADFSKLPPNVTELMFAASSQHDLEGLRDNSTLTRLRVSYSAQITDFSPIATMTGLEFLALSGPNVTDLNQIKGNSSIRDLWFTSVGVKDWSPLREMSQLQKLKVGHCDITDVAPFAIKKGLVLDLASNTIADFSPLAALDYTRGPDSLEDTYQKPLLEVAAPEPGSPVEVPFVFTEVDGSHPELTALEDLPFKVTVTDTGVTLTCGDDDCRKVKMTADYPVANIDREGEEPGSSRLILTFTDTSGTDEPEPTDPGTESPEPTDPGTESPEPTDPGTESPEPTDPGTESPEPTDPGTESPEPTDPGTESPEPEKPGTESPAPEKPGAESPAPDKPSTGAPDTDKSGGGKSLAHTGTDALPLMALAGLTALSGLALVTIRRRSSV